MTALADENNPECTICPPVFRQKAAWMLESEAPESPALRELNDEASIRESPQCDANSNEAKLDFAEKPAYDEAETLRIVQAVL